MVSTTLIQFIRSTVQNIGRKIVPLVFLVQQLFYLGKGLLQVHGLARFVPSEEQVDVGDALGELHFYVRILNIQIKHNFKEEKDIN